jgi:hypothetical protein
VDACWEEEGGCCDGEHVAEGCGDAGAGEDGRDEGTADEAGGHETSENLCSVAMRRGGGAL